MTIILKRMVTAFSRFRQSFRLLLAAALFALASFGFAVPATAQVTVHFHSFNGSVLIGRYPHTFVVFEGTLEETGEEVDENFGFSAISTAEAISGGPARHEIIVETPRQIRRTNRHFSVTVTDETYRLLRAEVEAWRNQPNPYYILDERNCIHFVARLAQMVGVNADVPDNMTRRPKKWLNYVTRNNPHLGAEEID